MYYMAEQLMSHNQPFILENNFENATKEGLNKVLDKYSYKTIIVTLTGDYRTIYERFVERNNCVTRHRGHVVNDCYPEKEPGKVIEPMSYESFENAVVSRGMDAYVGNGPQILIDTTDFNKVDKNDILKNSLHYGSPLLLSVIDSISQSSASCSYFFISICIGVGSSVIFLKPR